MTRIDGKVLVPVANSSHIAGIGYDPQDSTAYVQYATGQVWQYSPVQRNEWAMIAMSPSKGTAIHAIKRKKNVIATQVAEERIKR